MYKTLIKKHLLPSILCLGTLEKQAGMAEIVPFHQEETFSRTIMNNPFMVVLTSRCNLLEHIGKSFPLWFDIDGCPLVNKQLNCSNQLHMK